MSSLLSLITGKKMHQNVRNMERQIEFFFPYLLVTLPALSPELPAVVALGALARVGAREVVSCSIIDKVS